MARLLREWLEKRYNVQNAPSSSGGSGGGGGRSGTINRDPKTTRVARLGYQLTGGSGGGSEYETPDVDLQMIADAIENDAYLKQAVMKYDELLFKSGYTYHGRNQQAMDYLKYRLDMMEVATNQPMSELWQSIGSDIIRYSNAFIVKQRAKKGNGLPPGVSITPIPPAKEPVVGYFRLPPQTMQIQRDAKGKITGYQQEVQGGGDPITFRPENVIHIKDNVSAGRAFGSPWLASVLADVRLLRKIEENAALLMYRHIFPLLQYKVGLDKPGFESTDEEIEELQSVINDMPTDGALVLPERHNVEAVHTGQVINGKPYLDYFENRVFSGLGLSQVDFGRGDTANRNTADAMTGNKADRVKGWHRTIQTQIDFHIIDELLVEGGYDPLANPDFNIDFMFNEIELERKIAKENHEILKFNNNIQTWEETRTNVGHEPTADETRLHYQMIAAPPGGEVENADQPENQNGQRSGPKRASEHLSESAIAYGGQGKREPVKTKSPVAFEETSVAMERMFDAFIQDAKEKMHRHWKRHQEMPASSKEIIEGFALERKRMTPLLQEAMTESFRQGESRALTESGRKDGKGRDDITFQMLKTDIKETLDRTEGSLQEALDQRWTDVQTEEEAQLLLHGAFEARRFKWRMIAKTMQVKAYHYGYAIRLHRQGQEALTVQSDQGCSLCRERHLQRVPLQEMASLEEAALYYKIPPWHPNCECQVSLDEGGEEV